MTHASTASHLDIVYGTVGTAAAAFVDYPISRGVPALTNPKTTTTGTFRVPPDFACAQGDTFDSTGQLLVSGDTSSQQEPLTAIRGSCALGYSPRFFVRAWRKTSVGHALLQARPHHRARASSPQTSHRPYYGRTRL